MNYTILSAEYMNPDHTAACIRTVESAYVAISETDTPDEWAQMLAWGTPEPFAEDPAILVGQIKAECRRRILENINESAQARLARKNTLTALTQEESQTLLNFDGWNDQMVQVCRALVASQDKTFNEDSHWPPCPADVIELAERY